MSFSTEEHEGLDRRMSPRWCVDHCAANERLHHAERDVPEWVVDLVAAVVVAGVVVVVAVL